MNYRLSPRDLLITAASGQAGWARTRIPETLGIGYTDRLALEDGLTVTYSRYQPRHDLCEESVVEREHRSLTITIALEGRSGYWGRDGSRFDFLAGHTTMTLFGSVRGERRYLANEPVRQMRLIIDEALLRAYALDALLASAPVGQTAHQLFFGDSSQAVRHRARQLANLYQHQGHPLDIRIHALSLLAEQARRLSCLAPSSPRRNPHEAQVLRARDIMQHQYDRPLTLAYLCAAVGTNEFTLKRGFHDLFGTTPHRMLTDIRMNKACELLASGESVSSVAYKVGYQHPSSFSAAFSRHFGRLPKSLQPRQ